MTPSQVRAALQAFTPEQQLEALNFLGVKELATIHAHNSSQDSKDFLEEQAKDYPEEETEITPAAVRDFTEMHWHECGRSYFEECFNEELEKMATK